MRNAQFAILIMRIAILTNAFPPDGRGGAERIAWLQATGLASEGHEVRIWAPDGTGGTASQPVEVTRFRSAFHRLGRMGALSRLLFHLFGDIRPRTDVVLEMLEWKPDVLISHNLTGCGIGTPYYVRKKGIPWVHVIHDIQLTEPSGQLLATDVRRPGKRAWRAFWARYRKGFFGVPDVLASPTEWLLAWHRNYGFRGKEHAVLPNPVQLSAVADRGLQAPAAVLYVGRLSDDKGFGDFLACVPMLDHGAVASVTVIGDGPLRPELQVLRDDRIRACGWESPERVREAIRRAELLIAPSRLLENQQTIILEAMAEGTPVIATDVGGTRETLEGTGCPLVSVAADVPREIAKQAQRILSDKKAWRRISKAMRERAQRHDAEHHLDTLTAVIKEVT